MIIEILFNNVLSQKILIKLCIFLLIIIINKNGFLSFFNMFIFTKPKNSLFQFNQYFQLNNSKIQYFDISLNKYFFSLTFKIVKVEYYIRFFDRNKNIIPPSYLFYNDIQLMCHIKNQNINIVSLGNIYQDKYFHCIEFFNTTENIKIGIIFYMNNEELKNNIFFIKDNIINYNNLTNLNDTVFDPLYINNQYKSLFNEKNKYINEKRIKKIYKRYPFCTLKRNIYSNNNNWTYTNIYNHYFCFCVHKKCDNNNIIFQECKYFFYISIIDFNKNLYNKTHYLFSDFIFSDMPNDDTFPIFNEMIKRKFPVHYITEKKSLYNKYCNKIEDCLSILPINKILYKNYGNFLQKYFFLFLKLKAVISGRLDIFHKITQIFYYLEYITYIGVGHGVCYFKHFLYAKHKLYGINTNNKFLLPNSYPLISIAKKYGWKDKDIIKNNLPRWDKYNNDSIHKIYFSENLKNNSIKPNSIFVMFTWRDIKKNHTISGYYIKNIINLLCNGNLNKYLIKYNIILYFSLHRFIYKKYKKIFKVIVKTKKNINFIDQEKISECLMKTNLAVSDFSSIVFDLMYRKKPIIIYIPDANDPNIKKIIKQNIFYIFNH